MSALNSGEEDEVVAKRAESGRPVAGGAEEGLCQCGRCALYKWYPPLLLLSTAMAGVFCWMYLTKPVYVTQPGEGQPVGAQPAFQEGTPSPPAGGKTPPTAGLGDAATLLDPALGGLPGDAGRAEPARSGEGENLPTTALTPLKVRNEGPPLFTPLAFGEPDRAESGALPAAQAEEDSGPTVHLPGTTMRPLVVKRDGPPLFKPFVFAGPEGASAEGEADANAGVEEGTVAGPPGEPKQDGPEQTSQSAEEVYSVKPSFMAEFTSN